MKLCGLTPPLVASGFVDFHPGHVSSAVFAGLHSLPRGDALADERPPLPVHSTRRNPSLKTRTPKPPGNSPRVCAYGANVAAICFSGGQNLPSAFLHSRARHREAGASWPALGSLRSAVQHNVHSARISRANKLAWRNALRSVHVPNNRTFFAPKPGIWWGLRREKCSCQESALATTAFCHALNGGGVPQEHIRRTDTHNK